MDLVSVLGRGIDELLLKQLKFVKILISISIRLRMQLADFVSQE